MARLYVEHDMAKFYRKDITRVDMELYDGRKFENLEPHRLFPISGREKYITLLDEKGIERAVIRDLRTLPIQEQKIIEDCLKEYYCIPQVEKIENIDDKNHMVIFDVQTDKGQIKIESRGVLRGIRLLYGTRVLIRDEADNRYEIPDVTKLDKRSRRLFASYI